MTRITLSVLTLLLSTGCAAAQNWGANGSNWGASRILPPVEYEHKYPGELTISRLKTEEEMATACRQAVFRYGRAMGCNLRWGWQRCEIYIVADEILATVGLDYETALRHELGHCNGWGGDHAGARYKDGTRLKVEMPTATEPVLRPDDFAAQFLGRFFPMR